MTASRWIVLTGRGFPVLDDDHHVAVFSELGALDWIERAPARVRRTAAIARLSTTTQRSEKEKAR